MHFSQLFNEDNLLKDVLHEVLHLEQLEVYIEEVIIVILVDYYQHNVDIWGQVCCCWEWEEAQATNVTDKVQRKYRRHQTSRGHSPHNYSQLMEDERWKIRATRAFSWLKAAITAFTFKTLSRHYAKQALTPW